MEYKVEECPYKVIYLDLTTRCNMKCNYCYKAGIEGKDMDIKYFEEVCKTLPHKVMFRFLGGEPTIHPDFLDFVRIARQHHHMPTTASNGKMYLDKSFVKGMKEVGGFYGITMSGGTTNREAYKVIDNDETCLEWKMKALNNLIKGNITTIVLSAIISRGLNEDTIGDFVDLAEKNRKNIKFLKFRSIAQLGRYVQSKPYSSKEFINKLRPRNFDENKIKVIYTTKESDLIDICKSRKCCHYFVYDNFLTVSFVEFGSDNSILCWKRGKLSNRMTVESFFGEMSKSAKNEEVFVQRK